MATELLSKSIAAPGFKGLNTQSQGNYLDIGWASEANNCIVDRYGRLSARKGWLELGTVASGTVTQLYEYINSTGAKEIISSANLKLYSGTTTTTDVTGTITTPTADNWKFQNFNGKVVGWQAGHTPIVYSGTSFADLVVDTDGTIPGGNDVLAAWGRLWAFDSTHTVVRYSDLLQEDVWDDATTPGSSGKIDLKNVWTNGMDIGVALISFNGYLIIFGKNNILVYSGAEDPNNSLSLVEDIRGIGCLARDTIQQAGPDLVWLSPNGVETFGRVIQEQSLPYSNLSKNVRDALSSFVDESDEDDIRSVYYPKDGMYLLSLPGANRVYVFDMKGKLEDGTVRVTTWSDNVPTAMCVSTDQVLYFGHSSSIGQYTGYNDNGSSYRVTYYSGWVNLTDDNAQMMLKKLGGIVLVESGSVVSFKWSFDFSNTFSNYNYTAGGDDPSEYNVDEYNEGEYSGGISLSTANFSGTRSGSAIMFGMESDISSSFSIQRVDLKVKRGRIL